MKNLIIKQPTSFSRRGRIIIYSLGLVVIAFLFFTSYYQKKMYEDTINNGIRVNTTIIDIGCSKGRGKSRLYFRNSKKQIEHVNVSYTECKQYSVGDTISVYENEKNDWYEIDPSRVMRYSTKY